MGKLQAVFLVICVSCMQLGGKARGPEFGGTGSYHVQKNEEFYFRAYFRYCPGVLQCPKCPRQVYLSAFERSLCVANLRSRHFNCEKRSLFRRLVAPSEPGRYKIMMYEQVGGNRCHPHSANGHGKLVGVVFVGEFPTTPLMPHVSNISSTSVLLTWRPLKNAGNGTNILAYHIEYGSNGSAQVISVNSTATFHQISDLRPWSPYFIRMRAENAVGNGSYGQVLTFMTLGIGPYLNERPEDKELLFGEGFTLRCIFGGIPTPRVAWFKDGLQLISDPHGTFHVRNSTAEDSGVYRCEAFNGLFRELASTSVRVVVNPVPKQSTLKVTSDEGTIYGSVGQRLQLSCQLKGDTMMRYEWSKDNAKISQTSNENDLKPYQLNLHLNSTKDFGLYKCLAQNKAGATARMIRILKQLEFIPTSSERSSANSNLELYLAIALVAGGCLVLMAVVIAQRHILRRKKCYGIQTWQPSEGASATPRDQNSNSDHQYTWRAPQGGSNAQGVLGSHVNAAMSAPGHYMDLLPGHSKGMVRVMNEAGYVEVISGFNRDYVNVSPSNHNESAAGGMYAAPQLETSTKEGDAA